MITFEYYRVSYQTEEWAMLLEEGWRTVAVNTDGLALMRRRRKAVIYPNLEEA